jgi:hypothetical protein
LQALRPDYVQLMVYELQKQEKKTTLQEMELFKRYDLESVDDVAAWFRGIDVSPRFIFTNTE